jgi:hypothetical protein
MEEDRLFVNRRNARDLKNIPLYTNNTGALKKCLSNMIALKTINEQFLWYALDDLPYELQEQLKDFAIKANEMPKNIKDNHLYDEEQVKIYVTNNTQLLPIVGNFLPSDDIHAYTVVEENGKLKLKPILICWNCHWSELFAGITKYGENVFCLVSDLTKEQQQFFNNKIISLIEVPDYLEQSSKKEL